MSDPRLPSCAEEEEFFAAVGRAITDWANLEQELFQITVSILGCRRELAAIVFYRTPTIDSRLTLSSDLVHAAFPRHEPGKQPHPAIKTWERLQTNISDALPIRNRLAHHPAGPVVDIYASEDGQEHRFEVRQASYMSHTEALRKRKGAGEALGLPEIREHMKVVSRLINRLRNFRGQWTSAPSSEPGA